MPRETITRDPGTRDPGTRDPGTRDPLATGLGALAWTLGDEARAGRLLAVTGLGPAKLRARAAEPALLAAGLAFLEAHEPDLLGCADALGLAPADLVAARRELEA